MRHSVALLALVCLALVLGSPAHDYVGSSAYAGPTNCGQGSLVFVNTSCTQVVPPDACPGTPALKACCHTPATSIELDRWNSGQDCGREDTNEASAAEEWTWALQGTAGCTYAVETKYTAAGTSLDFGHPQAAYARS